MSSALSVILEERPQQVLDKSTAKRRVPLLAVYTPPPKHKDAQEFWPYMRCKNIANILKTKTDAPASRSHHDHLIWLANWFKMSLEEFKATRLSKLVHGPLQSSPPLQREVEKYIYGDGYYRRGLRVAGI